MLHDVPLFGNTKGEDDHLASPRITIARVTHKRNCIIESYIMVLHRQANVHHSLQIRGWCRLFFSTLQLFLLPHWRAEQNWPQRANCISNAIRFA